MTIDSNDRSNKCQDIAGYLDAYADCELDDDEESMVATHLRSCPACQETVAQINSLVSSVKELPKLNMSRDLLKDERFLEKVETVIKSKVESSAGPSRQSRSLKTWFSLLFPIPGPVIFASAAMAIAVTLFVMVPHIIKNAGSNILLTHLPKNSKFAPQEERKSKEELVNASDAERIRHIHTAPENPRGSLAINQLHDNDAVRISFVESNKPKIDNGTSEMNGNGSDSVANQSKTISNNSDLGSTNPEEDLATSLLSSGSATETNTGAETSDLLTAFALEPNSFNNELSISTDEDGLYAFKL